MAETKCEGLLMDDVCNSSLIWDVFLSHESPEIDDPLKE